MLEERGNDGIQAMIYEGLTYSQYVCTCFSKWLQMDI